MCPDCGAPLQAIKLFGRGPESLAGLAIESDLTFYTHADAERGMWSSKFKVDGEVQASICTSCRRIFLYGAPAHQK
jgi:hypothetical protein